MRRGGLSGVGSSPHTRGARRGRRRRRGGGRIIPAYAGSTEGRLGWGVPCLDHPRIRGEHQCVARRGVAEDGSSPHTRGAPSHATRAPGPPRIIPAYAGSTRHRSARAVFPRDHPRIRGEHGFITRQRLLRVGSSPHTRGAPEGSGDDSADRGIIPAYAGSTARSRPRRRRPSDHPRIRGEHLVGPVDWVRTGGSSPHTRGALGVESCRLVLFRDHPRIRGEHAAPAVLSTTRRGSSPHTRGALRVDRQRDQERRIIPAYAGSTGCSATTPPSPADHPRIRGEHPSHVSTETSPKGSSPHTRGAHQNQCDSRHETGIIPAYAGSTGTLRLL